ncbi:MAG: tRNA (adenosine(37)-N6)-dimethylallyltransferase MiaA [Sedimentisphaerales bacterium]|nr:tRNA (adenosine(37)-N6)-dimethylallyltransferase MiaA [Sedimentisphaerales bacterium]
MILILGVTASGKGRLAFELAKELDAEIISVDSMKVYRRMDIGTAKPAKEIREQIQYHMIDVVEPSEAFNVGTFYEKTLEVIEKIKSRDKKVIAVGGTGLYIKALLEGLFDGAGSDESIRQTLHGRIESEGLLKLHNELSQIDPIAAERINPNDTKRVIRALEVYQLTGKPISSFQKQWNTYDNRLPSEQNNHNWTIVGLRRAKEEESGRINQRVKRMILNGLVDEVESLLNEEKPLSKQAQAAIGYAEIINHLNGNTDLKEATELIKKNTRKLAKGQRTWFKTFRNVNWLDINPEESHDEILQRAKTLLQGINY